MENAHSIQENHKRPAGRGATASGLPTLKTFTPEERAIVDDACHFYFSPIRPSMARAYRELRSLTASANEARLSENKAALRVPSFATLRRVLQASALNGYGLFRR